MPSPLSDQILDFCESELFQNVQNSEVASTSDYCSYSTVKSDEITNGTATTTINTDTSNISPYETTNNNNNNNNDSISFYPQEDIENNISSSIDFTQATNFSIPHFLQPQQELFDISSLDNHQITVTDGSNTSLAHQYPPEPSGVQLLGPPQLGHVYEGESMSSMPSYMRAANPSPSCALLDPTIANYLPGSFNNWLLGAELAPHELDFQGENARIFCPDALQKVYNCSSELQAISNESQHLVSGPGCSNPLALEVTSIEDPIYKVTKLSVEERREKIHRYLKKRNQRNFNKKIKYACRKTLADSRPRVRGRFAKNDEYGEAINKATSCSVNEEDTSHEDVVKLSIMYHHDPNMVASSAHENNHIDHVTQNDGIFTSNCHTSNVPYDMCTPLYCIDGQMH